MRWILVGCVAQKQDSPARAADLYTSPLFRKRRAYAEATGLPWLILSAEHGIVDPETRVWPYERQLRPPLVTAWADKVARQLRRFQIRPGTVLEIHAGVHYVDGVRRAVKAAGVDVAIETPLQGLGIGEQMRWYGVTEPRIGVA